MALSGTLSNAYRGYTYWIEWSASQSVTGNYSTVTCNHKLVCASTYSLYINARNNTCVVNNTTANFTSPAISTPGGTTISLGTTTHTVYHNADGTAKVTVTGTFKLEGEISGVYVSSIVTSGSIVLDTIPRATTPTLSATSVAMGSGVTITLTPASSSFKHKLTYTFSTASGQTSGLSVGANFTAAGTTTVTFTPPTSLANYIPTASSGTCTIYCYTYNSSGTQIGSATSVNLTLSVPSYTPTVDSITLTGNNLLSGAYVKGKSSVNIKAKVSTSYGAYIKNFTTTVEDIEYTAGTTAKASTLEHTIVTETLKTSGAKTFTIKVTDSRGKTATKVSSSITVYDYSVPYITSFTLERDAKDDTKVIATLVGGFSAVNNKNSKNIKVTLNGVDNTVTSSVYTFNTTTTFTGVPTDNTLTGTLSLSDAYYTGDKSITKDAVLPTVAVTMDFYKDGKGIAMGKVAETSGLLDVAWNERVRGNLSVDGTCSVTGDATIAGATNFKKTPTISETDWKILILKRVNAVGASAIQFQNDTGSLGFIGMTGSELNTPLRRWSSDGATQYTVLDSAFVKDYIVDQGTSGIWTYRKWNSGLAECWGVYTMTSAATKTWGSLYYSDTLAPRINYPFTFTSRPQESAFLHGSSVAGWVYPEAGGIGLNSTTQTGQYGFVRPTSIASSEVKYEYTVVGRWK